MTTFRMKGYNLARRSGWSALALAEAFKVPVDRVEEHEQCGQGQVDEQRQERFHEGEGDRQRHDQRARGDPTAHLPDEVRIELLVDKSAVPVMYRQIAYPTAASRPGRAAPFIQHGRLERDTFWPLCLVGILKSMNS